MKTYLIPLGLIALTALAALNGQIVVAAITGTLTVVGIALEFAARRITAQS